MTDMPSHVILIKADTEWPVYAIPVIPGTDPTSSVEAQVDKVRESRNVGPDGRIKIWRSRLVETTELELQPARTLPPTLTEKHG